MAKKNSGLYFVEGAQKNGLPVRMGKGDHAVIYGPAGRGIMTVPLHHELATGTCAKIRKWFLKLGILLSLASTIYFACRLFGGC
jgi:hypothetical protein